MSGTGGTINFTCTQKFITMYRMYCIMHNKSYITQKTQSSNFNEKTWRPNFELNFVQVPGQGPTSYLDAAQREKALQSMQQMSSAQIVSATQNMHSRMAPPVTYGGFWHHPGLGQAQDVKPFPQNPFLGDKSPSSLGNIYNHKGKTTLFHNLIQKVFFFIFS